MGILQEYRKGLNKLVNSLSWGSTVINPQPIDPQETILYIDLRDTMSGIVNDGWTKIEAEYPYHISFEATDTDSTEGTTDAVTDGDEVLIYQRCMSTGLLAQASLPPLYHDLLSICH